MTSGVRTTTATVHRAVYGTGRHASVNVCLSQPTWTTTTKRTERNLFVFSGKSEAEVTKKYKKNCARRIVLLKLTTDRHEASRGLSATAGPLVYCTIYI